MDPTAPDVRSLSPPTDPLDPVSHDERPLGLVERTPVVSDIERVSESDSAEASRLLARAFADDPVITHFLRDPKPREVAFPAFFRAALAEALPLGHVYAIRSNGHLAGVAAWFPPDPPEPAAETAAEIERHQRVVRQTFPTTSADLFDGFAALAEFHPSTPHWYLAFVGIDPIVQGQGLGARLLSPVLRRADETRTVCYLETPFPRTHAFYRRLGFEPGREASPFVGAPSIWTFVRRQPQAAR